MDDNQNINVAKLPVGHSAYPQGCVIVSTLNEGELQPSKTTEYTLEEWEDLQNTQSSQAS